MVRTKTKWVLQHKETGKFFESVSYDFEKKHYIQDYTNDPFEAREYPTRKSAREEKMDSERVVKLEILARVVG